MTLPHKRILEDSGDGKKIEVNRGSEQAWMPLSTVKPAGIR